MNNMQDIIHATFGGKVRVRACGILIKEDAVLLLKHKGIGKKGYLWAPPGGGVEFKATIEQTLKREFKEECGIEIKVKDFLFLNEFIEDPLHAIELFYRVEQVSGVINIGNDPETDGASFLEYQFLSQFDLTRMNTITIHSVLNNSATLNIIFT